ncbi:MAG TPA: ABC transporter ATP-binding protein [Flavisolibacter sp.]|nr:ABC transporter ATP-binding protein [Flavisolibacter sp.]
MARKFISRLITGFLKGRKAVAIALIVCGVLSNCLAIFLSLSIGTYYETLSHHHSNKGRILHLLHVSLPHNRQYFFSVFLLLTFATTLFQFLFRFGSQSIALAFSFWLRKKLFRHHLRMRIEASSKKTVGSYLLRYSSDLKSAQSFLEKGFFQFGSDLFFIVFGILVLFQLHLVASIYVAAGFLSAFSLMHFVSLKIKKLDDMRTDSLSANVSYIHESLQGLETIKTWNKEFSVINRFKEKTDVLQRISVKAAFWKSLHYVLPFAIMFLLLLTVFFTHSNTSGPKGAAFIPYILLLLLLFPAIKRTMRVSAIWKSGNTGLRKLESFLQQPLENEQGKENYEFSEGKIEFHHVSFSYDAENQVLSNMSFTWEPGKINYLDCRGSTTVFKLLVGLYQPAGGTILLDGTDLDSLSLKSVRRHIAFCSDQTVLHGNTPFKCLFLDKSQNYDEVRKWLRILNFSRKNKNDDFDLHCDIGKGGRLLSRSDYQKLKIARTVLSRKKVLMFDGIIEQLEPTVQQAVIAYLEMIKSERTIILTTKYYNGFAGGQQSMMEKTIIEQV